MQGDVVENTPSRERRGNPHRDRSPLNWLLLVPLVLTLYPPLYNRRDPELFGIPFFYWYQLAAVVAGVVSTYLVYRATRTRS